MTALVSPKVTVVLDDGTELADIQTINADLVRFDRTRAAKKWPQPEDAKILWLTYVSWAACTRLGLLDIPYEDFESKRCVGVIPVNGDRVDPTQREVGHD